MLPAPPQWRTLLSAHLAARSTLAQDVAEAIRFRRQLGLADGQPSVMSGHQATLWHMGIAAKWLALACAGRALNATTAWLVVDHDPVDFCSLHLPVASSAQPDVAQRSTINIGDAAAAASQRAGVPPCLASAFSAALLPDEVCLALTASGNVEMAAQLDALAATLTDHQRGPASAQSNALPNTAAQQIAATAAAIISQSVPASAPQRMLFSSTLCRTDLFAATVARMSESQQAAIECISAYNQAAAAVPHARIAPLICDVAKARFELPLWQLDAATGLRKRVFLHTLGKAGPSALAPRALLQTGLLRWMACDLFIHGLGGGATAPSAAEQANQSEYADAGGYDQIAERWFAAWLGVKICPSVVVTATAYLHPAPSAHSPAAALPTEQAVRAAFARAHQARHQPALLGSPLAGPVALARAELAGLAGPAIRSETRRLARRGAYRTLHDALEQYRRENEPDLSALQQHAAAMARELAKVGPLGDRTYSFVLHGAAGLQQLHHAVAAQFHV